MSSTKIMQTGGAAAACWLLCVATSVGQDREALNGLERLHDELCGSPRIVSAEDGQAALDQLRAWNLSPRRLDQEQCGRLLGVEISAHLAVGEVQRAKDKLAELRPYVGGTRALPEAEYLLAAVTGDAQAAEQALKKLTTLATSDERRLLSQRRRWAKRLGTPAPDVEIAAEGGTRLAVRERYGVVLVIDFWNRRDATEEYAAALKALYEAYRSELRVQFVGVNTDGKTKVAEAHAAAERLGYTWPQCYEGQSEQRFSRDAFGAASPPWTVVVDGHGTMRAVGAVTEPAFQYALRIALMEASAEPAAERSEEQPPATPPNEPTPAGEAAGPDAGKPAPPVSKNHLPSNPEARRLLQQARTFLKTGMKKKAKELLLEIIRKYPGTREAKDAQERLALLP